MSNIYVPIDASNVREVIPPGEDIVYSTFMMGTDTSYSGRGMSTSKFTSHIVLTPNGIAYTDPRKKKRKDPIQPQYTKWAEFRTAKSKYLFIWGTVDKFEFVRMTDIETKDEFNKKVGLFPEFVFSLVVDYGKRKYAEMENDPSVKEKEKRKMLDFIKKNTAKLEKAKIKADKIREKYGE